jgi:transglutaminase-like putative cysteine protease
MSTYLGGRWYTFDARNNMPRIGRVDKRIRPAGAPMRLHQLPKTSR